MLRISASFLSLLCLVFPLYLYYIILLVVVTQLLNILCCFFPYFSFLLFNFASFYWHSCQRVFSSAMSHLLTCPSKVFLISITVFFISSISIWFFLRISISLPTLPIYSSILSIYFLRSLSILIIVVFWIW